MSFRFRIIVFNVMWLSLASCDSGTDEGNGVQWEQNGDTVLVIGEPAKGVIFHAKIKTEFELDSLYVRWTPSLADVEQAEAILLDCIESYNKKAKIDEDYFVETLKIDESGRQYVGIKNSNNEKIIFINCFCNPEDVSEYWKKVYIKFTDGGACNFNVKVNLKTNQCFDLM